MMCLCGHTRSAHLSRGRCCGDMRVYLKQPVGGVPTGSILLEEKARALRLAELVDQAETDPNYETRIVKILRRGYEIEDCNCEEMR